MTVERPFSWGERMLARILRTLGRGEARRSRQPQRIGTPIRTDPTDTNKFKYHRPPLEERG